MIDKYKGTLAKNLRQLNIPIHARFIVNVALLTLADICKTLPIRLPAVYLISDLQDDIIFLGYIPSHNLK